jgi:sigma-B regulation protein RsbU (phosphoserine phosphatase)
VIPELFARRSEYRRFGMIGDTSTWGQFALRDWEVTSVPFQFGTVNYRERSFIEAHVDIVKVLAEALSLGYVRFLNLQDRDQAQQQLIEEMEKELDTAHDLQMDLMPSQPPSVSGCDFAGRCIPATHVGGDFFQYFPLAHDRLAIGMADVTGHAMEAAIPVVMFSGILKGETRYNNVLDRLFGQLNLEDLFFNLNNTLYESLHSRTFVCFAMAEFNAKNGSLRLSNSGFPYPDHFNAADGSINELSLDAYPLGIRPNTHYQVLETQLASGDYIAFCSDGIIEASDAQDDFFGYERTAETIRRLCTQGPTVTDLVDGIFTAVQDFTGDKPQSDDMTCVVLKVE